MRFTDGCRERRAKEAAKLATADLETSYEKAFEALKTALEEAAIEGMEDEHERNLARKCPRHFFDPTTFWDVKVDGKDTSVGRCIYLHCPKSARVLKPVTSESLIGKLVLECKDLHNRKSALFQQVETKTLAALRQFSTVKKCREGWPEIAHLLPKEPTPTVGNLPVLRSQIETLNKLIPLPPVEGKEPKA